MSGGHLSKEFFELVKSIGESRSKQEEDKIIVGEISILKNHLTTPGISAKKMKEYMVRSVYCEMLGHNAEFAYIHAVKLTQEKNLFAKRIGYLTSNLFLHKDHELVVLLINTMQRDLQSANHLEVCCALVGVSRLANLEMLPVFSPLVLKLLSHPQEIVRKKAIVTMNRFFKIDQSTVLSEMEMIRKVLCDPDPSVMGASLHILYEIAKANPSSCKDLVLSFVSILKQITEHRLPRDFDYHRMPAPWLQVKLLSILGILGHADKKSSEAMYEILQECMRRADSGVNVGYAIIYECVKCITKIYPDGSLLELAASNISRFISSDNHNLKYLGVTGLAQIVQVNATFAAEHQRVVVDCLEDPDDTLKRKTLDLLYRMTNRENVTVVVDKLTFHMRTSVDMHLRQELVQRITSLAERFAPDNHWYLSTMNTVFELGGDLVPAETAHTLLRIIAEVPGSGEDEDAEQEFISFAVNTYLTLLDKPALPDVLIQVIAWVMGEYARLATVEGFEMEDIIDLLCETIDRPFEDPSTRGYIVNALMKLTGQFSVKNAGVDTVIKTYRSSRLTDLQQRCYEFEQLRKNPTLMQKVLPYDASAEDITVDQRLSFLDNFVQQKLADGAQAYQTPGQRIKSHEETTPIPEKKSGGLKITPYQLPTRPDPSSSYMSNEMSPSTSAPQAPAEPKGFSSVAPKVGPWAPQRASVQKPPEPPAPAAPVPSRTSEQSQAPRASSKKASETQPEAPSEKDMFAASLFKGVGAGYAKTAPKPAAPKKATSIAAKAAAAKAGAINVAAKAATAKSTAVATPAPKAAAAPVDDLLDFGGDGGAPVPSTSPAAAQVQTSDDLNLIDFGSSPQADVPAPASIPVAPTSPLAPLQVSTQQVGQQWGSLPPEQVVQIATSCTSCQDMMTRLQARLNVHPVQVIGTEGICAGRVLPGNDPCFLHGSLTPPRLTLKIKVRDPVVAQKVAEMCQMALA